MPEGTRRRWCAAAAVAAIIFAGSTLPERTIHAAVDPVVHSLRPNAEFEVFAAWRRRAKNAAHLLEYAGLAIAVAAALRPLRERRSLGMLALALGLVAAYAVTDELHQSLRPGRTARVSDWALDVAGASAGLGLLAARDRLRGTHAGSRDV
jgi:hypothetical protein